MDFQKYKNRLQDYLSSKGYNNFSQNICCPFHAEDNPSMKVHEDSAICFAGCGNKDIYDFIGLFENLSTQKEQYIYAEKKYGTSVYIPQKKDLFKPDPEASKIITDYMRTMAMKNKVQLLSFAQKRGYSGKTGQQFARYFGFWPGFNRALKELGEETLKKAGVPFPKKDQKYSSWHAYGAVTKFEDGWKLFYVNKHGDTIKRGSHGSRTFPYPALPENKNRVILVEAEISANACRVYGFNNIVATGGVNGLNKQNAKRLLDYKEICFLFDGDDPGRTGAEKNKDLLKSIGYKGIITILNLPDGFDPDDMLKNGRYAELLSIIENKKELEKQDDVYNNMEESFYVSNAVNADELRENDELLREMIYVRKDLAPQEAARLYFVKCYKTGIKLQNEGVNDVVWVYDEKRKYWSVLTDKLGAEPMELFIKRYGASWFIEGKNRPFIFTKTNQMRAEIDRNFHEIIKANIIPQQNPFKNSYNKKIISCNNCVLEWDFKQKKFVEKPHGPEHNLTVAPFPYNRIDMKNLNADQLKRKKLIEKYLDGLVKWNEDEDDRYNILQFLLAYIGYTLTPWREKCFHVWIGKPDSGKSLLLTLLSSIHGSKFGEVKFAQWSKHNSQHDSEILPGKLLIADDDFEVGGRLPEQELKTLSQNGTVTINPKHISQFSITNTATPLILTNGSPRAEDITLENRLYALEFKSDFSRTHRTVENEEFINQIKEHETLEILFNAAIDVAEKSLFREGNFDKIAPECVKQKSMEIIGTASSIHMWISDMIAQEKIIVDTSNKDLRIKRTDLYQMYQQNASGMKKGLHAFYEAVRQKYEDKKLNGNDYFIGIAALYKTDNDNSGYDKVSY